jgi:hypothetical protein
MNSAYGAMASSHGVIMVGGEPERGGERTAFSAFSSLPSVTTLTTFMQCTARCPRRISLSACASGSSFFSSPVP